MKFHIENSDCLLTLRKLKSESVDMIITSPPYDNLRNYKGYVFDFENIAKELSRVLKKGGSMIWVVGDQTKNGSESLTSFKQAIYFVEQCKLKLHDTMVYRKINYQPLTHKRYEQEFEYMFCFVKGSISTFNPIMIPCKYAGVEHWGEATQYKDANAELVPRKSKVIKDFKIKGNIFEYRVGSTERKKRNKKIKHPAVFPKQLALDMIQSFSNEGDVILDPFTGSGTSCIAAMELNRNFIGCEISKEYYEDSLEECIATYKDVVSSTEDFKLRMEDFYC